MTGYIVLTSVTLFMIFILFLVVARTMNSIINMMIKTEYLLQKENELKTEALEVRRVLSQEASKGTA
ncbi:MAG TPA: hypothetical protein VHO70_13895 [Chitinispirillaceae bacterium]|nr:hypothetical protein [Chitinispirillaceae bacterium]